MNKGIFITGTNTDIGKTFVAGHIVKNLMKQGIHVGYYKACASGSIIGADGKYLGDASYVGMFANMQAEDCVVSYEYEHGVSPHLAAKFENRPVELAKLSDDFQAMCAQHDFVVVEGSGGIICPLRYDTKKIMLTDVIQMTGFSIIIVTSAQLGSINATLLTIAYAREHGFKIKGVIINNFVTGNILHEDNKRMMEELGEVCILACIGQDEHGFLSDSLISALIHD